MSKTSFGLPLSKPSVQTVLPVMGKPSAQIYGFLLIPEETFDGTESYYATADGNVPVETVTLPIHNVISGGRPNIGRVDTQVTQYMAAVWDDNELVSAVNRGQTLNAPWAGLTQFLSTETGFYHRYIQASNSNFVERLQLGTLIDGLVFGMDSNAATPTPNPPTGDDATLNWTAKVGQASLVGECPYFDFAWTTLFDSHSKVDSTNTPIPQRLEVVTVPDGFKAFLVNRPTVVTGSNLTFDTVRIVVVDASNLTSTDYQFEFLIVTDQGSVPVTLTLTVEVALAASTGA